MSIVPKKRISKVDKTWETYDAALKEGEAYIQSSCKNEIENLKEAEEKLQKKLNNVLKSDNMIEIEEKIDKAAYEASASMKKVQRELQSMHDAIDDDLSLDTSKRKQKHMELNKSTIDEYHKLTEKYPAAARAHLLSQVSVAYLK